MFSTSVGDTSVPVQVIMLLISVHVVKSVRIHSEKKSVVFL
jgi:hypothetical protein